MMRPLCMILGVGLGACPPPKTVLEKVLRPPMVVGGGLEEDVCEVKDTAKQKKKGDGSRPVPLTVGEQDLPDPFIRWSKV